MREALSQKELPYDAARALAELSAADPLMSKLIEQAGPFTLQLRPMEDVFHPLLRAIVYQQLSGRAAETIYNRVLALSSNGAGITPQEVLAVPPETLRAAGMSWAKIRGARDLAEKVLNGELPSLDEIHRLEDAAIVTHVTRVRGIGPWTAEMLLIFSLGRPDVLPVTDLGVRKGFMLTYGGKTLPTPADLLASGERWRPWRSVASWYLWRAVDLATKQKQLPGW
jgi:DNA-3-methyladenine glycosylase II